MSADWIWGPSLQDLVPERFRKPDGQESVAAYIRKLEDIIVRAGTDIENIDNPKCDHQVVRCGRMTILENGESRVQCAQCAKQVEKRLW